MNRLLFNLANRLVAVLLHLLTLLRMTLRDFVLTETDCFTVLARCWCAISVLEFGRRLAIFAHLSIWVGPKGSSSLLRPLAARLLFDDFIVLSVVSDRGSLARTRHLACLDTSAQRLLVSATLVHLLNCNLITGIVLNCLQFGSS